MNKLPSWIFADFAQETVTESGSSDTVCQRKPVFQSSSMYTKTSKDMCVRIGKAQKQLDIVIIIL